MSGLVIAGVVLLGTGCVLPVYLIVQIARGKTMAQLEQDPIPMGMLILSLVALGAFMGIIMERTYRW